MDCKSVLFFVLFVFSDLADVSTEGDVGISNVKSESHISEKSTVSEETKSAIPYEIPEVCPSRTYICGFQVYDKHTREPLDIIKYCKCPEHSHCVKAGENKNMKFFYYRCKENLEDGDEKIPTYFTKPEPKLKQVVYEESSLTRSTYYTEQTEDSFYSSIEDLVKTTENLENINELYAKATVDGTTVPTTIYEKRLVEDEQNTNYDFVSLMYSDKTDEIKQAEDVEDTDHSAQNLNYETSSKNQTTDNSSFPYFYKGEL